SSIGETMAQAFTNTILLAATVFSVASVHNLAQAPAKSDEIAPPGPGVAIVVRDVDTSSKAWADVAGVPPPTPFIPQHPVWPPHHDGDRPEVGPRIASVRFAMGGITMHEPPAGRNYWRELLEKHGETFYRFGWGTDD